MLHDTWLRGLVRRCPGTALFTALLCLLTGCGGMHRAPVTGGAMDTTAETTTRGQFRLDVINVGYGDCLLLRGPGGETAMVDCGPREAGKRIAAFLREQEVERIDLLVLTHPHPDHIDGLAGFIDRVEIGRILESGLENEESLHAELLARAAARGVPLSRMSPGMRIEALGEAVQWEVIHLGEFHNINEASAVMRLQYGSRIFLLMGDAEVKAEQLLLKNLGPEGLRADVVKVGHHANVSDPDFIAAMTAEAALVTLGENPWNAPNEDTLTAWQATGAHVLRTDIHGDISVVTDGESLVIAVSADN
jgi:competence protein ComEC